MRIIFANNLPLTEDAPFTYLSSAVSAGDNTIPVDSIVGFTTNKILLITNWGNENAEIIKTSDTTAPTGNTITLATNLVFNHSPRDKVYIIPYNKIEISHANTPSDTKTVLDTISLQPDQIETRYVDTTATSGYYFWRWNEDINNTFSDYSDPIPFSGFGTNQVVSVIEYALKRNKQKEFTDDVDFDFCISEINSALKYITGKMKKITDFARYNYNLGILTAGENSFNLPSDIYDKNGNRSIYSARIQDKRDALIWKPKYEWDELIADKEEGEPLYYTVYDGILYIYPVPDATWNGKHIYLDYYTQATEVNSAGDTIDFIRYDMVKYWLTWAIRAQLKYNGERDVKDTDFVMFSGILNDYINTNINSHKKKLYPRRNGIFYR